MPKVVKLPPVVWLLGDTQQSTLSGVTRLSRVLYYRAPGHAEAAHAGFIDPDYAEVVLATLQRGTETE